MFDITNILAIFVLNIEHYEKRKNRIIAKTYPYS